jgi:hypothetical protein
MGLFQRFPSLSNVAAGAGAVFKRFPFVMGCAFLGSFASIYLIETSSTEPPPAVLKLVLVCALGLSLFTALTTFAERQTWPDIRRRLFPLIGVVVLAAYFLSLPDELEHPQLHLMRFFLLGVGLHFLVAFIPFMGKGQVDRYWEYNKSLFLGFLTANVYAMVLYAGLSIALVSADKLFGLHVDEDLYFDLFVVLAGIFNTWVFLGHIPTDLNKLDPDPVYPSGLKILAQFILLPLVVLYFFILITYEAKIVVTWNWPKGWVSQLVLWFSVVGILSLLLLYPLQRRQDHRWIARFGKWFFRALVPLVVMLYFAIAQRIGDYGITVNRHLVLAMAVGLTIVVLYFVFSKGKDIRVIPLVLSILAFGSAYGPVSAFSVSERSQQTRLEIYLTGNDLLKDGVVQKAAGKLSLEDRREMSSIVSYLAEWHGAGAFAPWFADTVMAAWQEKGRAHAWREDVTDSLGFAYVASWRGQNGDEYFHFNTSSSNQPPLAVTEYDYLLEYSYGSAVDTAVRFGVPGMACRIDFSGDSGSLSLIFRDSVNSAQQTATTTDVRLTVSTLIEEGLQGQVDQDRLTLELSDGPLQARFLVRGLSGRKNDSMLVIESMRGWLLFNVPSSGP